MAIRATTHYRMTLRAVFYKERANWIAHVLEFDLVGHGRTKKAALKMLTDAIMVQIEASRKHNNMANLFTPADGKFFAMFAAGKEAVVGELRMRIPKIDEEDGNDVDIESLEVREYEGTGALALA